MTGFRLGSMASIFLRNSGDFFVAVNLDLLALRLKPRVVVHKRSVLSLTYIYFEERSTRTRFER